MDYNFDELIERKGTNSLKYDFVNSYLGADDLIPLWVADMDFRTPDFVMEAMKKRLEHPVLGYSAPPDSFYESIIYYFKKRYNWEIQRSWVYPCTGIVTLINICINTFTNAGDKIIVQPPLYFPFLHAIIKNRRNIVYNPLIYENDKYTFDFDNFEKLIDKDVKMLLLCNPHNPIGRVWTKDELKRLGEICVKHKIIIVSDELHADFVYKPAVFTPIASISEEISDCCIVCSSASKTYNLHGLSIAFFISQNKTIYTKLKRAIDNLNLGTGNIFGVIATEAAYNYEGDWLDKLLSYLQENKDFITSYIAQHLLPISITKSEGTFLAWIDFRKLGYTADELLNFTRDKAKVGLVDGRLFGPGGEGYMRMNFAHPRSVLKTALENIRNALNSQD